MLPSQKAHPESGWPAYQWRPREVVSIWGLIITVGKGLIEFDNMNNKMKKESMLLLAPPKEYVAACKEDWDMYCDMFQPSRPNIKRVEYPYDEDYLNHLLEIEQELTEQEE